MRREILLTVINVWIFCYVFCSVDMEAVVLKQRHSLIGKSLVPVILKVRTQLVNVMPPENMAKLKKDHLLSLYSLDELKVEFEGLTGENMTDVLVVSNLNHLLLYCV